MEQPYKLKQQDYNPDRRTFIRDVTIAAGAAMVLSNPLLSVAQGLPAAPQQSYTVGEIMDMFIREVHGAPFPNTVDTLKSGDRDIKVTGIVTTMFATIEVIKKAIALGANFIIAHEPTFYNHTDDTSWLQESDVYQYKADLLKQHSIAVWRNHDDVHSLATDGVRLGVLKQLRWEKFGDPKGSIFNITPAPRLSSLIEHVKERLNIKMLRYIGDLAQPCQKVLLMVGAAGGRRQIDSMIRYKPDVLVCGEISEWETAEYVRDARAKGDQLSLIVLGHIASEEPGSEFMLEWLKQHVPAVKSVHIPSQNSLSFA
jgi:putative NIF3 family GTP cyclohydrolase 1 type 2